MKRIIFTTIYVKHFFKCFFGWVGSWMVTSLQSLLASILHSSYSTVAQLLLVTGLQSRSALTSQVISMCSSFPPSTSSKVFHLMLPTTSHWVLTVGKSTSFSTIEHSSQVTGVHFSVPAHTWRPSWLNFLIFVRSSWFKEAHLKPGVGICSAASTKRTGT